jgi:hypothetical protein
LHCQRFWGNPRSIVDVAGSGQQHRDVISRLYEGLKLLYADRTDRLVMAEVDLYQPDERLKMIPDVAVVFGLPQSQIESYHVDRTGPAPTVVIEVVSRFETEDSRGRKLERYARMGVPEVWFLHIHRIPMVLRYELVRTTWNVAMAEECDVLDGVRFVVDDDVLDLRFSDGTPFPESIAAVAVRAQVEAARAGAEAARAEAEVERAQAEAERAQAEAAHARAEAGRAGRLASRLREMGVDPDTV